MLDASGTAPDYQDFAAIRTLLAAPGHHASPARLVHKEAAAFLCSFGSAVDRTSEGGWLVVNREPLFERHLAEYPGTGRKESLWRKDPRAMHEMLQGVEVSSQADTLDLLSGDFALDAWAPERVPTQIIVYARRKMSLRRIGYKRVFAPGSAPGSATVRVVVPEDPTLITTAQAWRYAAKPLNAHRERLVTDPMISLHEALRMGGRGTEEIDRRLTNKILRRSIHA